MNQKKHKYEFLNSYLCFSEFILMFFYALNTHDTGHDVRHRMGSVNGKLRIVLAE